MWFDRMLLQVASAKNRPSQLTTRQIAIKAPPEPYDPKKDLVIRELAFRMKEAVDAKSPRVLFIGGHLIKSGLSRYLLSLIADGWITHLASNGAALIHDYELARIERTSEDVATNIQDGTFGLWQEIGELNELVSRKSNVRDTTTRTTASQRRASLATLGEWIGEFVVTSPYSLYPGKDCSVAALCNRLQVPWTAHVLIGGDVFFEHPNCCGRSWGESSYHDFLAFTHTVSCMNQQSVFLNAGSAVTGPEVFLKALAMARNMARQKNQMIEDFTTAVFDRELVPEHLDARSPTPSTDPWYYRRPWKTLMQRTTTASLYVGGDLAITLPKLWEALEQYGNVAKRLPVFLTTRGGEELIGAVDVGADQEENRLHGRIAL